MMIDLEMTTGELKYPICTTCYYPYVADNVKDGRLCFENGTIVLPKTNRMVFFGPDVYHNVEPFTGEGFLYFLILGMSDCVKLHVTILGGGIWYD